jgi:hypothetical protein
MRVLLLLCAMLLAAGVPGGCASSPGRAGQAPFERTTVRVENRAFLDMNIYVLQGTQRIRLGTVTGNTVGRLTIPRDIVASAARLRFLADPVGSNRTPVSEEFSVRPGDEVVLTIPPV